MTDQQRAYLHLHFCVLLWGFTAVLGGLISLDTVPLVWWRVSLCCAGLLCLISLRQLRAVPRAQFWRIFGIGLLVGLHWICFYAAVKCSNASVGVITMAMTSFFSALTEPILLRQKIKWYELGLGMLILPGMALVAGSIDFSMRWGLFWGLCGAFLCAIFSVLNKMVVSKDPPPPFVMSFIELFAIVVLCSALMPFYLAKGGSYWPKLGDWKWLFFLAFACTLLPWRLTLIAMKHISAFAGNLALNLEPIYGVILAGLILHEHEQLHLGFYAGAAIIVLAVLVHPFLKPIFEKNNFGT